MADIQILIKNRSDKIFEPIILEDVQVKMCRKGTPETLTFTVLKDQLLGNLGGFHEGNSVWMKVDNKEFFAGFIFKKERNKTGQIKVTAYSQMRYLKNKYTLQYTNKTATEVVQDIAGMYQLTCAELVDTKFVIAKRLEDNQTMFDIIQNAIDDTCMAGYGLFVLYDDYGKLTLKSINDQSMILDYGVDAGVAQDFSYSSSIDEDTYTDVVLIRDNEETGEREKVVGNSSLRDENRKKWGILQYFSKEDESVNNLQAKADMLLEMYGRETRHLSISGALGDTRIIAGRQIFVNLNLGDFVLQDRMLVEEVTHKFSFGQYFVDLKVVGSSKYFS